MRNLSIFTLGVLVVVLWAGSFAAGEPPKSSPVWEQVHWGMGAGELQALYPDLSPLGAPNPEMSSEPLELFGRPFAVYDLLDRSFGPLRGCRARFFLLSGTLYQVQFNCPGTEPEDVERFLVGTYGFPLPGMGPNIRWELGPTSIGLNTKSGYFALMDTRRSENLSKLGFAEAIRGMSGDARQAPEGSPEVTEEQADSDELDPSGSSPPEQSSEPAPEPVPEKR